MGGRPDWERVEALHAALRDGLGRAFLSAGWLTDPAADTSFEEGMVASFRRSVAEEFSVTASFVWLGDFPPLEVLPAVGLSYHRSYRAWPSLIGATRPELYATYGVDGDVITGVAGGLDVATPAGVELWELQEVDRAVDVLGRPVLESAVSWAAPLASLDALLDALQRDVESGFEVAIAPVVLAAAGRIEEARQAMAAALRADNRALEDYAEFLAKFTTWLDSGAMLPDPPASPLRDPSGGYPVDVESLRATVREVVHNRREAFFVVRDQGQGQSREDLREMLENEYARRDIVIPNPRELELLIDVLEATSASERRRLAKDFVKTAINATRAIVKALGSDGDAEDAVPQAARLPPDAAFPIVTDTGRWNACRVHPTAETLFESLITGSRADIGASNVVDAWVTRDDIRQRAEVHIGTENVGYIDADAAPTYMSHIQAAESLGLLAVVPARITKRRLAPHYLLELAAPRDPSRSSAP